MYCLSRRSTLALVVLIVAIASVDSADPSPAAINGTARLYDGFRITNPAGRAVVQFAGRKCSGVLIANNLALTAEHCKVRKGDSVRVGRYNGSGGRRTSVNAVQKHPSEDLAIVRLSKPSPWGHCRRVIADTRYPASGSTTLYAMGHGWTDRFGRGKRFQKQATWQRVYRFFKDPISGRPCAKHRGFTRMCVKSPAGSICPGDSGGPVFHFNRPYVVGIMIKSTGCRPGANGILVPLAHHIKWIRDCYRDLRGQGCKP